MQNLKWLLPVLLLASSGKSLLAQTGVLGSLTAASASCLSTNCVELILPPDTGSVTVQLSGTFSATAQFEGTNGPASATYVSVNGSPFPSGAAVSSATATGTWVFSVPGLTRFRVRVSSYTSGTVTARIQASRAFAFSLRTDFPAGLTATTVNLIRYCNEFAGADGGAKIAACIADLPSTGGIADARGLEGAQSWASNPFSGVTKPVTLLLGDTTITESAVTDVPNNVSILGLGINRTIIATNSAITMMSFQGVLGTHKDRNRLAFLTLDGNATATKGILVEYTNRTILQGVEVREINGPALHLNAVVNDFRAYDSNFVASGNATNPMVSMTGTDASNQISDPWMIMCQIEPGASAVATPTALLNGNSFVVNGRFLIKAEGRDDTELGIDWSGTTSSFSGKMTGVGGTQVVRVNGPDNRFVDLYVAASKTTTNGYDITGTGDRTQIIGGIVANTPTGGAGTFAIRAQSGATDVAVIGTYLSAWDIGTSWGGTASSGLLVAPIYNAVTTTVSGGGRPLILDADGLRLQNADWFRLYDTGGVAQNVLSMDASDDILFRQNNTAKALKLQNSTNTKATVDSTGVKVDGSLYTALTTVTFSATPTFDASLGNSFKITLTGNVTSSTLSNPQAGQLISWLICQDATGSRTFVWPTNVKGGMTIGSTLSTCSAQNFLYDGTNAYALSGGVTGM